ncbi:MAG: ABC transporter permease [Ignavibacteriales bacterium]|nr:ABC transporter permease [Ignavibacteriales bacterium]
MSLQRIIALLRKEFGQLFKDKRLLPLVFLAPVLQLTFLGFAASLDVKNISMVICDLDKSLESRSFIQSFSNSGYFTIEYSTEDYNSVRGYVDNNKVNMALVIPPRFGNKILSREPAKVQILLDGSEGSTAAITMGYVNQIIMGASTTILTEVIGGKVPTGRVDAEIRAWYNPSLKSRNYMVPGVLVLILLITTMNLTAMAIVKEKEVGTLEQIMVTPIRPVELILGKLIPFTLIGLGNVAVVLSVMVFGFDIPVKGSVILLFVLSGVFLLNTLGIGLFVSTISRTQQQAMMTTVFFIVMPMMYISGFVFPIENMPKPLQVLSLAIPMRYYLTVIRSIILKGVGLKALWPEACIMLVMGITILSASVMRFRKKLD